MVGIQWLAGVALKKEKLEDFRNDINEYIEKLNIQDIKPSLNIDMEVTLKELSIEIVKELSKQSIQMNIKDLSKSL